uniref:U2A'/phosphoprotein 32 family A C-terminal domain-containing protein n=1 Tax=Setaria digitata TaxID=48799 RepID=A0A915PM85_9BILA
MVRLTESIVYSRTKITVESVRKLNLWGCDIDDIGLCSQMINLQILSLSMNRVKCLKPLENCMRLEELYLRKNEITSLSELEHLRDLKMLRTLWIDENPCTADNKHRAKVLRILPNLTRLDDKPVTIEELLTAAETNHQYKSNNDIDDNQRTVIDKIIPNHPRIQELRSDRSVNDPEHRQQLPPKLMATSLYEGIVGMGNTENRNFWQDFNLEVSSTDTMFHSMQDVPFGFRQQHKSHMTQQRSISHPRTASNSIPRHRKERIISAIGVLLDELDADGLRDVVDEAQRRIKKLR